MASGPIRVLCADDHPLILDGVARLLERENDMVLVAEANNGIEAVRAYRQHQPDVTLMDLQMPELNGVDAIHKIREVYPRARCVVLTTYRGDVQASRAFKAGAVGYLLKTMLCKDLIRTIRDVHARLRHVLYPDFRSLAMAEGVNDSLLRYGIDLLITDWIQVHN
jgi:DNA-binding NarL/FixJ family response regulator